MKFMPVTFLLVCLLSTYAPAAKAHSAPSRCRVDIYDARNGHTTTDIFVGHKNDGDTLTASYVDMGKAKTAALYTGWNHIGVDVTGVTVTDKAGKKVC